MGQPSPPAAENASLDELKTCIAPGTRESWLNSQGCTAIGHAFVEVSVLSADAAPAIARTARRAGTLVAGPEAVCAM